MKMLSATQLKALRWIDQFPSHRARWVDKDGRQPSTGLSTWTHFEITGTEGVIKIKEADMKALHPYIVNCPSRDKMYGVNEAGRAILEQAKVP